MIRIALLGCDSTHTEAFASRINGPDAPFAQRARVVSLWGENAIQAREKAAKLAIGRVAASPEEALQDADFAMVIGRFADSHFKPARAALEHGIPTFVDKPFVPRRAEAETLAELSRAKRVPLCSSSPLRFAKEVRALKQMLAGPGAAWTCVAATAPATCTDLGPDPRLDSAFFYGIHSLEVLLELAGHDITRTELLFGEGAITVHLDVGTGRTAAFQLIRNTPEFYRVDVYTPAACKSAEIELDGSYYGDLLRFLIDEFCVGRATIPLDSTIAAIGLLERIDTTDPKRKGGS